MSDPEKPRVEWTRRADSAIAEAAEAVGVSTDGVLAATESPSGGLIVLWTETGDDDAALWSSSFVRDADGVFVQSGERVLVAESVGDWLRRAGPPSS